MDRRVASATGMMILAAVLWGFSGFFSRGIMSHGYSPYDVTTVRLVLSCLILFVILALFDRKAFRISRKDIPMFLFFGLMKLLSDLTLFIGQESINLSVSTTLQTMSPVYVIIITVLVFKAVATFRKVLAVMLSVAGSILVTGVLTDPGNIVIYGVLASATSGLTYAIYTIGAKISVTKGYTPSGALFWMFLVSAVLSLPFGNFAGVMEAACADLELMGTCIGMAVLITLAPYWLQLMSLDYLDPNTVNIIGVLEVVVASMLGFIVYGENISISNLLGMVLVCLAIILSEERRRGPKLVTDNS